MIDLTDIKIIKSILREHKIDLRQELGQNFLINRRILDKIVEAGEITKSDTVIEIGAGLGCLTQVLCDKADKVFSYEVDGRLAQIVQETAGEEFDNLELIRGDFLEMPFEIEGNFKVIANLPYQITTPVVRRFLEGDRLPERMVLLIQKEVAQRLASQPGQKERGWVSVLVQMLGEPKIVAKVKKEDFWPAPEVDGAVLAIDKIAPKKNLQEILRIVKAGFSGKRKKIANALAGGLGINLDIARDLVGKAGIDEEKRAEDLTNEEWETLNKNLKIKDKSDR